MTRQYTHTELLAEIATMLSGKITDANGLLLANRAVRYVVGDIDLRSCKRSAALSPGLLNEIYEYSAASDMKGTQVIDVRPQIKRGRFDYWRKTSPQYFDQRKNSGSVDEAGDPITLNNDEDYTGDNLLAVRDENFARVLLLSRPVSDSEITVSNLDSLGDWEAFGDATNVTKDADNYVKGSASLNFDINADGGATAGLQNTALDTYDLSDYLTEGSFFVWAYLSDATDVTNFIIRLGNDSSNYYYMTVTTDSAGNAFAAGWNLLRFAMSGKTETGTVDDDACDYAVIYMTKDTGKISETDYRFDHIIGKVGNHYNVIFYSRYGWYTNAGARIENSTTGTDLLTVDTDEVALIEYKMAELAEQHLRNKTGADVFKKEYELMRARYTQVNPSEALLEIEDYYNL